MKISVRLGNEMAFSMQVDEDKARETFVKMASLLMGCENTESAVTIAYESDANVEKVCQSIVKQIQTTVQKKSSGRLIFFKCEECARVQYRFTESGETVECIDCKYSHEIGNTQRATYTCPNCNAVSILSVEEGLETVPCKKCSSPIDLIWHEQKKMYMSANMI